MPRWWNARRFDRLEMVLVCGFAAALAGVASVAFERWRYAGAEEAAVSAAREIAPLRDRFGPGRHSEHREEWIIRDYFAARGYVVLGRYLRADPGNLYFAPAGPRPAGAGVPRP